MRTELTAVVAGSSIIKARRVHMCALSSWFTDRNIYNQGHFTVDTSQKYYEYPQIFYNHYSAIVFDSRHTFVQQDCIKLPKSDTKTYIMGNKYFDF